MKTCLAEIIFKVWAIGLGLILGVAFCYAIWSVFTGNYSGTACREF